MPGSTRERDFTQMTGVEGLADLQKELRRASPEMAKRLQVVNKKLVMNIVNKARAAFYSSVDSVSPSGRTGPLRTRRSGKGSISRSRDSIRGTAGQREAKIVAGGPKAPGFFGHEFGGSRGITEAARFNRRGRRMAGPKVRTRQFPVHKGREGYVLYPIVREEREHAFEDWSNLFDEVFDTKGPE